MDLFLIKLGKAWNVLKRDGFWNGAKRITDAFFKMFRRVGSGDILFVTNGVGDSARYRCHHVAEELELHGFKCSITVQDNPFLASYADKFKIFIFHRTLFTDKVSKLIEKIKKQNKEIIFEADDLVYDPKYLEHMDFFQKMNGFEKKLYENGLGGEILRDPYVKVCTTTTSFLADKLREENKKVFIVPNKLSNKDLKIADVILSEQKRVEESNSSKIRSLDHARDDSALKIGYFSGTNSHDKDFATITDALTEVMQRYPQVKLVLAGPLEIEDKLSKFSARIERLVFAPREKHFENKAGVDIVLSPLEMGNSFCESKSELKFSESGVLKVPTVAVANQTFREAISDGVDGFLAGTTEVWVEKLSKLIESPELRKAMGEKARKKALQKYSNKNSNNEEYYNYLRSKLV